MEHIWRKDQNAAVWNIKPSNVLLYRLEELRHSAAGEPFHVGNDEVGFRLRKDEHGHGALHVHQREPLDNLIRRLAGEDIGMNVEQRTSVVWHLNRKIDAVLHR